MSLVFHKSQFLSDQYPIQVTLYDETVTPVYSFENAETYIHTHEFLEICYVYAGKGYHLVNDERYEVTRGDLFLINFSDRHLFFTDDHSNQLLTYNVLFLPEFLDDHILSLGDFENHQLYNLLANCFSANPGKIETHIRPDEQLELEHLLAKMLRENNEKRTGYLPMLRGYLIELMVFLLRSMNSVKEHPGNDFNHRIVADVIGILHDSFPEKPSLRELAKKALVSQSHICALFKQQTGQTLSCYVQSMRIKEACRLIEEGELTLGSIAAEVGYSDYKAFYSAFLKITGHAPGAGANRRAAKKRAVGQHKTP